MAIHVLQQQANKEFIVDTNFQVSYLAPIGRFVQWKLESDQWDDYNELYHASHFLASIKREPRVWLETHLIRRDNAVLGVLFIMGGELQKVETKYQIDNEQQAIILKYFHIIEKGKGYGNQWLKAVIFPHYKARGYRKLYTSSSHESSFPFYARLGSEIAHYQQISDNKYYERQGRCFVVTL
jgi:hypothetical protein